VAGGHPSRDPDRAIDARPALLMPQAIRVISSTIMMMIRNIALVFFLSR
jgi:hypothetical protein